MSEVMVVAKSHCPKLPASGALPWRGWDWPGEWTWLPRARAETDEDFLQIIPYAVITGEGGGVWCYRRDGGDRRLHDRFSCGVGGHVDRGDYAGSLPDTVLRALRRELVEELGWHLCEAEVIEPLAWIYEGLSAIGRVHLGLVFALPWPGSEPPQPTPGEALSGLGFWRGTDVLGDDRFELWSRLAVGAVLASSPGDPGVESSPSAVQVMQSQPSTAPVPSRSKPETDGT